MNTETENLTDLRQVKRLYTKLRRAKRAEIIAALNNAAQEAGRSLKIKDGNNAGQGITSYGKSHLPKTYDLSNWQWIEAVCDDHLYIISLQAADTDPSSKNSHALFDRISFSSKLCKTGEDKSSRSREITKFDLEDLDAAGLSELVSEFFAYCDKHSSAQA